uniref:Putative trypsin-like peptidase domain containing protein n=1 Tax=viral metagenome TaxID=1070528 RepID=A0A6M3ITC8_9ZZZZ
MELTRYQKEILNRLPLGFAIMFALMVILFVSRSEGAMTAKEMHEKMIYPVIRVSERGSGTIIYSKPNDKGAYSTYALTNHHVISDAIQIIEEWNSDLQKKVEKEKRSILYVEIFQYKNLSTPIGTLKVEAELIIYSKDEDLALLKFGTENQAAYVAEYYPGTNLDDVFLTDETFACGCSLGFPPIITKGMLIRKNFYIDSLPFGMSSAQIIFGNSGGAMYTGKGEFIGIPSRVPVIGWSSAVPHMGLFIPIGRICDWLKKEHYEFIFDITKSEKDCLDARKKEIEANKAKKQ